MIDLGRVPGLAGIREWDGGVAVGAMTRQRAVERSTLFGGGRRLWQGRLRTSAT